MDYPQHNVLKLKQLEKLVFSDGSCLGFESNQLKVQMTGYFVKVIKKRAWRLKEEEFIHRLN